MATTPNDTNEYSTIYISIIMVKICWFSITQEANTVLVLKKNHKKGGTNFTFSARIIIILCGYQCRNVCICDNESC